MPVDGGDAENARPRIHFHRRLEARHRKRRDDLEVLGIHAGGTRQRGNLRRAVPARVDDGVVPPADCRDGGGLQSDAPSTESGTSDRTTPRTAPSVRRAAAGRRDCTRLRTAASPSRPRRDRPQELAVSTRAGREDGLLLCSLQARPVPLPVELQDDHTAKPVRCPATPRLSNMVTVPLGCRCAPCCHANRAPRPKEKSLFFPPTCHGGAVGRLIA